MTKPPLLRRGPLSGAVFVVTGYRQSPDGAVVVSAKHDVTDQYEALLRDDPRIAAVRALTEEWERRAICARADAAVVARRDGWYAALVRESSVTADHAAELRRVLDDDTPGGAS